LEYLDVEAFEQHHVAALLWRRQNHNAAAFRGWKFSIVEIIAIEADEGAAKLPSKAVMLIVTRAAQVVVFDHEKHVPVKDIAHERDQPSGHIRVHVDARMLGTPIRVGSEL
jgi:hypothetical protein